MHLSSVNLYERCYITMKVVVLIVWGKSEVQFLHKDQVSWPRLLLCYLVPSSKYYDSTVVSK
jgi:hypothetical protein